MLHVTNGSVAGGLISGAGMRGSIVPWNDVLHEGPVPAGLGPAALRARRAAFLASWGTAAIADIERELAARDLALEHASSHDEIVLWFEHDLYDQLQLLQVLDLLPGTLALPVTAPPLPDYIGHLRVDQIAPLFSARLPVSGAERSAARDAWAAFRAPDPTLLSGVLPRVTVLPHLAPALERHLQQFPSLENGLSRTEHAAFAAIGRGARDLRQVFLATNSEEEAVFMGDLGFLHHVSALARGPHPLLEADGPGPLSLETCVRLTVEGERVLAGRADRVELCGIDRWLGGVHLCGHGPVWRWDRELRNLVLR